MHALSRPPLETLAALVGALVAIDSVNPTLVPAAPGERAINDFVVTSPQESTSAQSN